MPSCHRKPSWRVRLSRITHLYRHQWRGIFRKIEPLAASSAALLFVGRPAWLALCRRQCGAAGEENQVAIESSSRLVRRYLARMALLFVLMYKLALFGDAYANEYIKRNSKFEMTRMRREM